MMKQVVFILTALVIGVTSIFGRVWANSAPPFQSSVNVIPADIQKTMLQYSWHAGCPLPLSQLVYIKMSYWGFDHQAHTGEMIVNKELANDTIAIFKALYAKQYPIEKMQLIDAYKGSDDASLAANNTSAFNCRAVTGKTGVFSQHSYGRAIDINPLINPYVKGKEVLPPGGVQFVDRTQPHPAKITKDSFIYNEFKKRDWDWGGDWHDLQDYQHFEKRANSEKRNPNGS